LITHFLGEDEVAAYCRDFARRLTALGHNFPAKWFVLGESGEKISALIFELLPSELRKKVKATTVYVDRKTNRVRYANAPGDRLGNRGVLLIDSAVHSGQSMSRVVWSLWQHGASSVLTYTLMLKRSSKFIPTYFGILVEDKDRVYFQLDEMPNNRLCETPPFGVLKEVEPADFKKKLLKVGPPFEDLTIGDLLYEKRTRNYHPYLYELNGQVAGFINFGKKKNVLFVDAWATAKRFQGKGIGGALLRWAETWGRSNRCDAIELWAFKPAIKTYKHLGFEFLGNNIMKLGTGQSYSLMGKKLLYNSKLSGHWP
jgi:GNAT superfamily N-acetyltransferase